MKYRRKPIEVEAFKLEEEYYENLLGFYYDKQRTDRMIPNWVKDAFEDFTKPDHFKENRDKLFYGLRMGSVRYIYFKDYSRAEGRRLQYFDVLVKNPNGTIEVYSNKEFDKLYDREL